jgi:hypothetical protein
VDVPWVEDGLDVFGQVLDQLQQDLLDLRDLVGCHLGGEAPVEDLADLSQKSEQVNSSVNITRKRIGGLKKLSLELRSF